MAGARGLTRSVLDLAALEAAYAFFEQAQAFVEGRDGAKLDFDRLSPIMEGPQNLGLHVAHLLDQSVTELVHLLAEFVQVLFSRGAGIFGHVLSFRLLIFSSLPLHFKD
jgi:hypothetical protein